MVSSGNDEPSARESASLRYNLLRLSVIEWKRPQYCLSCIRNLRHICILFLDSSCIPLLVENENIRTMCTMLALNAQYPVKGATTSTPRSSTSKSIRDISVADDKAISPAFFPNSRGVLWPWEAGVGTPDLLRKSRT